MGLSVAQYEETPALTVDWDLELQDTELRVEKLLHDKANK
jgi:hypothetical protein